MTFCGLGFIALGYVADTDSDRFRHLRRFGMTPPAYWALGFWSFFALALADGNRHPWLTALDGVVALAATLYHLRDRLRLRRARPTKEPTT